MGDNEEEHKDSETPSDKKNNQKRNVWHQFLENLIPKEYLKSQKVTSAPNLISQTEPSAPKEKMGDRKGRTDVYIWSGATETSVFL